MKFECHLQFNKIQICLNFGFLMKSCLNYLLEKYSLSKVNHTNCKLEFV